ncbi:acyl carrier protein [Buchnera aphidicola (Thelaxes californica)]|uniref:Acyl carrier protein n=1 Tax=Buchnera aphidicola (Thelaxes californica) TaxID=1315998 RepID=A0A4D6Y9W0_9GAMM|nr:acyl carrier protein [Buchnera aphidicola]QCI26806.1 acyl carrier protein [Buchnera aphidicola (Thelaxes californica)]
MENITKTIKKIISKQFGIEYDKISNKTDITVDLKADSLDMIEFIMELENEFDIEISDEDIKDLNNVEKIVQFVFHHSC